MISLACNVEYDDAYLKHGQQQMLFSAFILIAVDGKHDSLQQRINLSHCHESTQVRNVPGLGLQEKQEISISLRLFIVWKEAFLEI